MLADLFEIRRQSRDGMTDEGPLCMETHFENITHFEKKIQSALNLISNQRTMKKYALLKKNVKVR